MVSACLHNDVSLLHFDDDYIVLYMNTLRRLLHANFYHYDTCVFLYNLLSSRVAQLVFAAVAAAAYVANDDC